MAPEKMVYLTEQEEARARLKASIDQLADQANLQVQMQKEPLKMLGGASAVGALLGVVAGRQFRRTKKVYVDAGSPVKHQKALISAQQKQTRQSVGGALVATLGTLAFKTVMDKVITPRLEEMANSLLDKAGQPQAAPSILAPARPAHLPSPTSATAGPANMGTAKPVSGPAPAGTAPISTGGAVSFLKPAHPGVVPMPESKVEAKAQGTPITPAERTNPNAH